MKKSLCTLLHFVDECHIVLLLFGLDVKHCADPNGSQIPASTKVIAVQSNGLLQTLCWVVLLPIDCAAPNGNAYVRGPVPESFDGDDEE